MSRCFSLRTPAASCQVPRYSGISGGALRLTSTVQLTTDMTVEVLVPLPEDVVAVECLCVCVEGSPSPGLWKHKLVEPVADRGLSELRVWGGVRYWYCEGGNVAD